MRLAFALKGIALGFSIAAPVGPIGVLCIRRSMADGRRAGVVTGLGAATADAMYGAVAAFGVTAISGLLVAQRVWLGLLTNPMTILSFVAIFAGLGLASAADRGTAAVLVGGVFLGSALWWILLSAGAACLRSRASTGWMRIVNRCSGAIIFAFGLYALSTVW